MVLFLVGGCILKQCLKALFFFVKNSRVDVVLAGVLFGMAQLLVLYFLGELVWVDVK